MRNELALVRILMAVFANLCSAFELNLGLASRGFVASAAGYGTVAAA
jgi:hypothetical protein